MNSVRGGGGFSSGHRWGILGGHQGNQVKRTIEPHLPLEDMITGWNDIAKLLAERPRTRNAQLSQYFIY